MRQLALLAIILSTGLSVSACDIQAGGAGGFSVDFASGKATDTWSPTDTVPAGGRFELINVKTIGRLASSGGQHRAPDSDPESAHGAD
jgi:hypothetical protein